MRLAFMGTPAFAIPALTALHKAGHDIVAVYCQPPRPAGRGKALQCCPVQQVAETLHLPVLTPSHLRSDTAAQKVFSELELDAAVVAAYGQILPGIMLNAPHRGCLNIHASLLPRWRGAAPIQAAVLAGDKETGITIMQMNEGLDTGDILVRRSVPIASTTTSAALHDHLAAVGATLITSELEHPSPPQRQSEHDATYAPKLSRKDGRIDWNRSATEVDRQIRAFDPWPGTFTTLLGQPLKILAGRLVEADGDAGTVLDESLTVACGQRALKITRLQIAGRAPLDTDAFLRGNHIPSGTKLGT
jgi:methionyl-tRNA formyltransferase